MAKTADAKATPQQLKTREAGTFTKRIGHTVYRVGVHFSNKSGETAQDKILRLVKNEASSEKGVVNQ
ncbi:MAG: hypothetical protein GX061_05510 [Eubacteriaceae bacterium]|nr:hypothetical protein [Eubacteriaceae bacterium]